MAQRVIAESTRSATAARELLRRYLGISLGSRGARPAMALGFHRPLTPGGAVSVGGSGRKRVEAALAVELVAHAEAAQGDVTSNIPSRPVTRFPRRRLRLALLREGVYTAKTVEHVASDVR